MQSTPIDALDAWVRAQLTARQLTFTGWVALRGDAGFRQYFRLNGLPYLAVYAPPATENNTAFVNLAQHLRQGGLAAPEVLAWQPEQGFLLVEDLGEGLYLPALRQAGAVDQLYPKAIDTLLHLQQLPADLVPAYDGPKLRQELELFPEWFIGKLLGYRLNADEQQLLLGSFERLEQSLAQQPQVLVHRDFHSRNLVLRQDAQGGLLAPGLIDFQDALKGPATYDLVSLLRDCYIAWPRAQVEHWALGYYHQACALGIWPRLRDGEFLTAFDYMGLQRHLKVLGIFARLHLRDDRSAYLNDLPLVWAYVLSVVGRHRAFSALHQWLLQRLLPQVQKQPWYKPLPLEL